MGICLVSAWNLPGILHFAGAVVTFANRSSGWRHVGKNEGRYTSGKPDPSADPNNQWPGSKALPFFAIE